MLSTQIQRVFAFLVEERGFSSKVIQETNIWFRVIYINEVMEIEFSVEEMDSYFELNITLQKDGQRYSISPKQGLWREIDTSWKQTGLICKSIFDFTDMTDEVQFRAKIVQLYKEKRSFLSLFGGAKKAQAEILALHRKLLEETMDNINLWLEHAHPSDRTWGDDAGVKK